MCGQREIGQTEFGLPASSVVGDRVMPKAQLRYVWTPSDGNRYRAGFFEVSFH